MNSTEAKKGIPSASDYYYEQGLQFWLNCFKNFDKFDNTGKRWMIQYLPPEYSLKQLIKDRQLLSKVAFYKKCFKRRIEPSEEYYQEYLECKKLKGGRL